MGLYFMDIKQVSSNDSTWDLMSKILQSLPAISTHTSLNTSCPIDNSDSTWDIASKILRSMPEV